MLVETQRQYCHYFLKWNPTCLYWDFQAASSFKISSKSQEKIKEIQKIKSPSASWWRNCDFLHCHHQCHLFQYPRTWGHTLLSSSSPPATLHTAGVQLQPSNMQQTKHHGTPCPLLGYPSPAHATDFSDLSSYFRYAQLAWNKPKLRNHWVKTQASSPSAVAPLQTTLRSP